MTVLQVVRSTASGGTFSDTRSHAVDRVRLCFDEPNLVANAGLLLVGTLVRLELERLVNATVRLSGRAGGARPGRKVLTLVHAMVTGASHIDHADVLRPLGRHGPGAAVPGHGTVHPRYLLALVQLRPRPPARSRGGRSAAPGVGGRGRPGAVPVRARRRLHHLRGGRQGEVTEGRPSRCPPVRPPPHFRWSQAHVARCRPASSGSIRRRL